MLSQASVRPHLRGGVPPSGQPGGGGYPIPGQDRGCTPFPGQDREGTPLPGQDRGGTSLPGQDGGGGYLLPRSGRGGGTPNWNSMACTSTVAFTEDFLVLHAFNILGSV